MRVTGDEAITVPDLDKVSITATVPSGNNHCSGAHSDNRRACRSAIIHGKMGSHSSKNRMKAGAAEPGRDARFEFERRDQECAFERLARCVVIVVLEAKRLMDLAFVDQFRGLNGTV